MSPTLPQELEAQIYQILFERPEAEHDAEVTALTARHPDHATAITELFGKLKAGIAAFPGWNEIAEDPEQIGPYRILEKIGEGGFGVVYLAEQREPIRRRVALKCLLPGMDSRRVLLRFEAERQALALMSHPNIAQVFDVGATEQGRPFIVMEHVPGLPLTTYCEERKLDIRERLALFVKVCEGVQHAHQKGIIHRDLKPSNLLVAESDGRPVPKIIDFGVAKALHQPLATQTLFTKMGHMLGTPEYMSPEQAEGRSHDIDTRADVYSLGVILYEILTGTRPLDAKTFRNKSLEEIQRAIREQEPQRPSTRLTTSGSKPMGEQRVLPVVRAQELRGDLDSVVMKAIAKERSRRYESPAGLAADLRRFLDHEPVLAHPPGRAYLLRKFVRRHSAGVAVAVLLTLALVAGLAVSSWYYVEAKQNLGRFEQLSDGVLLEELQASQRELWPEHPDTVPDLKKWLDEARPLAARLQSHEHTLAELEARGTAKADGVVGFADPRDRFLHKNLVALVARLREFDKKDGVIQSIAERLTASQAIRKRTVEDHETVWEEARKAIALDKRFGGFDLKPQVGLIPLGADPESGLWEFAHFRSGAPASRRKGGNLAIDPNKTGLVLVLLPGGKFQMGSQSTDRKAANYDPWSIPTEGPVHEVTLSPFFLSKYEMTQGQWKRTAKTNNSRINFSGEQPYAGQNIGRDNPVEDVTWFECVTVTRRLGLVLPTEAQWEYACRAGKQTPFYTGDRVDGLVGHVNLRDEGSAAWLRARGGGNVEPGLKDGYRVHGPVTAFAANPFGLVAMHGNIEEWTRDWVKIYAVDKPRAGDGYRGDEPGHKLVQRVIRGGSFWTLARGARCATRGGVDPGSRVFSVGLRPARALDE